MANILRDSNFAAVLEQGPYRLVAPFPHTSTRYVLEQDYTIDFDNFTPLALNTAHPTLPTYKLVSESALEDFGAGVAKFTRTFAQVPDSWSDYDDYTYTFIGFLGALFEINVNPVPGDVQTGRQQFPQTVSLKKQRDYYLIGSGGSYATPDLIPAIQQTRYLVAAGSNLETKLLWDAPPADAASYPSRTTYEALIATDSGSASSFSIVVEASRLVRWMGNIWCRETNSVKAL